MFAEVLAGMELWIEPIANGESTRNEKDKGLCESRNFTKIYKF